MDESMETTVARYGEKIVQVKEELMSGRKRFQTIESEVKCLIRFKDKFTGTVIAISIIISSFVTALTLILLYSAGR